MYTCCSFSSVTLFALHNFPFLSDARATGDVSPSHFTNNGSDKSMCKKTLMVIDLLMTPYYATMLITQKSRDHMHCNAAGEIDICVHNHSLFGSVIWFPVTSPVNSPKQ